MKNQKLKSSHQTQTGIPDKWKERFLIKRIDEDDIIITLEERDGILRALNEGDRFIQVTKYTLMLNSIKSIDPFWPPDNIPPRPKAVRSNPWDSQSVINKEEIILWESLFREKKKLLNE